MTRQQVIETSRTMAQAQHDWTQRLHDTCAIASGEFSMSQPLPYFGSTATMLIVDDRWRTAWNVSPLDYIDHYDNPARLIER